MENTTVKSLMGPAGAVWTGWIIWQPKMSWKDRKRLLRRKIRHFKLKHDWRFDEKITRKERKFNLCREAQRSFQYNPDK
jgi:hypothetical protein